MDCNQTIDSVTRYMVWTRKKLIYGKLLPNEMSICHFQRFTKVIVELFNIQFKITRLNVGQCMSNVQCPIYGMQKAVWIIEKDLKMNFEVFFSRLAYLNPFDYYYDRFDFVFHTSIMRSWFTREICIANDLTIIVFVCICFTLKLNQIIFFHVCLIHSFADDIDSGKRVKSRPVDGNSNPFHVIFLR